MFSLTPEQRLLQSTAADMAAKFYAPVAAEWDRNRVPLPADERQRLADLGYIGMTLPPEFGGGGASLLDALLVIEEFAKVSMQPAFAIFEGTVGPVRVIDLFGTDEQKRRFLPPVIKGRSTVAIAISEPDAGSAATDLTTHATHRGDSWILNGHKRWCSGAGHAEQYLVYARMSDQSGAQGIGAIIVDKDASGLSFGPREELLGFRGIPSADMYFDDVSVPEINVIVRPGEFSKLFQAFTIERLGNATMSLALGQAALDFALTHVQERKQFGRPIMDFQMVQQSLANMLMEVEASRLLIWRAASSKHETLPSPLEASVAKCFANEMAKRVADQALQIFGGYGYSTEYPIERILRDAYGWAIAGGTPSIQRIRIVSQLLNVRFDQRN